MENLQRKRKNNRTCKCFVPFCGNSRTKTPEKLFVHVPGPLKKNWCERVNVPYKPSAHLYCCEEHLNLEEDLENYHRWKWTGCSPKLKKNVILRYHKDLHDHNHTYSETSTSLPAIDTQIDDRPATPECEELKRLLLTLDNPSPEKSVGLPISSTIATFTKPTLKRRVCRCIPRQTARIAIQTDKKRMVDKSTQVNNCCKRRLKIKPKAQKTTNVELSFDEEEILESTSVKKRKIKPKAQETTNVELKSMESSDEEEILESTSVKKPKNKPKAQETTNVELSSDEDEILESSSVKNETLESNMAAETEGPNYETLCFIKTEQKIEILDPLVD